jgi:hypothetical protein
MLLARVPVGTTIRLEDREGAFTVLRFVTYYNPEARAGAYVAVCHCPDGQEHMLSATREVAV